MHRPTRSNPRRAGFSPPPSPPPGRGGLKPALHLLLALVPALARAEGAVQTFDCDVTSRCDAGGTCEPASDAVAFRIEPVEVGPGGEGDYAIAYGGESAAMTNVTGLGPLLWTDAAGNPQAILLTGDATLLWQSFDAAIARSTIAFLACEVTQ